MDDKPIFCDNDLFTKHEICLDIELQNLVGQQYQQNDKNRNVLVAHV
jgi:hypothetical protein